MTCHAMAGILLLFCPRFYHSQGQTAESIEDAGEAVNINNQSAPARAALGTALYTAGHFESALVQFYKANR